MSHSPSTASPVEPQRFAAIALDSFGTALLTATGMPTDRARDVAAILLEGDLLGHTTHGFALLAPYLKEIESGSMQINGDPEVIADKGAAVTWDGRRLPGPWLTLRARSGRGTRG